MSSPTDKLDNASVDYDTFTLENKLAALRRLDKLTNNCLESLVLFTGPMFSKKSTSLVECATLYDLLDYKVIVFKPKIDNRYSTDAVVTHDGLFFKATNSFGDAKEALSSDYDDYDVFCFDEIQFFSVDIYSTLNTLRNRGKIVICSGLNADFMGNPFETTSKIAMCADTVTSTRSTCAKCDNDAMWTQMVVDGQEVTNGDRVQVGGVEMYEPRCRGCFVSE